MTETRKVSLARNIVSMIGAAIALIALANIVFLVVADATGAHNPYVGILAYAVVPGILVFGLAVFVLGLILERRRRRRMAPEVVPEYPDIDLNNAHVRRVVIFSIAGLVLFVTVSLLGSYQAYHYTDSTSSAARSATA